jgi:A1 cistron-splicing factor AAR2
LFPAPLVDRLTPELGLIRSALDLTASTEPTSNKNKRPLDKEEAMLPQLTPAPGTALRVTCIPQQHWPEGATPAEITRHSIDASYALETVLAKYIK